MSEFVYGLLGGVVPATLMVIVYFMSLGGRLAKIETDICWLKKELRKFQQH